MKLTRRELFGLLAAAVVDPERLLWRPGERLISIPAPRVVSLLDEINEITLRYIVPEMTDIIFTKPSLLDVPWRREFLTDER